MTVPVERKDLTGKPDETTLSVNLSRLLINEVIVRGADSAEVTQAVCALEAMGDELYDAARQARDDLKGIKGDGDIWLDFRKIADVFKAKRNDDGSPAVMPDETPEPTGVFAIRQAQHARRKAIEERLAPWEFEALIETVGFKDAHRWLESLSVVRTEGRHYPIGDNSEGCLYSDGQLLIDGQEVGCFVSDGTAFDKIVQLYRDGGADGALAEKLAVDTCEAWEGLKPCHPCAPPEAGSFRVAQAVTNVGFDACVLDGEGVVSVETDDEPNAETGDNDEATLAESRDLWRARAKYLACEFLADAFRDSPDGDLWAIVDKHIEAPLHESTSESTLTRVQREHANAISDDELLRVLDDNRLPLSEEHALLIAERMNVLAESRFGGRRRPDALRRVIRSLEGSESVLFEWRQVTAWWWRQLKEGKERSDEY